MPRFRIKTLLIATALVAICLAIWVPTHIYIDGFNVAIPVTDFSTLDALGLDLEFEEPSNWWRILPYAYASFGYGGAYHPRIRFPLPTIVTVAGFASSALWLLRSKRSPKTTSERYTT
jgi:hypothetical protein